MIETISEHEVCLSLRLKGPLAAHVDRQVGSSMFNSHDEYIRDLIMRDMQDDDEDLRQQIIEGYTQLATGQYDEVSNEDIIKMALQELEIENVVIHKQDYATAQNKNL